MVIPDDDALPCILTAHHIARNNLSHDARVREDEIFGDYAAPAIGPKLD